MKKILWLLACGLLVSTTTPGFASERNPAPIEETVSTDLDYDYNVVISSVTIIEKSIDFDTPDHIFIFGENCDIGLMSEFYFSFKNYAVDKIDYGNLKSTENYFDDIIYKNKQAHGGVIIKISLE